MVVNAHSKVCEDIGKGYCQDVPDRSGWLDGKQGAERHQGKQCKMGGEQKDLAGCCLQRVAIARKMRLGARLSLLVI